MKNCIFLKESTWRRSHLAEIGQQMDFKALFNEIYIKIEVFTSLELSYTSVPIAQLAACIANVYRQTTDKLMFISVISTVR